MHTYYRSPDIMVTSDHFAVLRPYPILFRIDELDDPYIVRHGPHPARRLSAAAALLAPVVVAVLWPHLRTNFDYVMGLAFAIAPTAISGACFRVTPRSLEIRARCGKDDVRLFRTTDATTFGQVRRALVRAFEQHDEVRAYAVLN
jgi:hypothetical protein